jgi:serine/threonine-protein kinase
MPDRQLGPYQLVAQLAVGGMAEIYSAKTAGVGGFEKLVALKVIHPNYSEDPDFVQMLVDEAKLAVHLQHANIVQTFDLGRVGTETGEQYYIAMELIDGVDLYQLLRRSSEKDMDFPFEVAAFIAEEAAQGLDYAHRKRDERGRPLEIVHRDISPQNILCSFDGEVKIVDFGIAKAARRAKQTAAGVIKGKYYYMSPEQAWGDPIDHRTDIFSTGILLYEMLVGQMLYLEEDMDVLLDKVRKANIPKPSVTRKDVPVQLENLVMKALAKRPQDRFQSAAELAAALSRFVRVRAPDFNRGKLATWVRQVIGKKDAPERSRRDPRLSTAVRRAEIERDENSLLFKLDQLKQPSETKRPEPNRDAKRPEPNRDAKREPKRQERRTDPDSKPQANAPKPRQGDQATSPVKMPELAGALGDYEENEATIVDSAGDTMAALARHEDEEEESTREMGPSQLRRIAGGQLEDDPAADTAFDPEEAIDSGQILAPDSLAHDDPETDRTSLERMKSRASPVAQLPGVRSPAKTAGLYEESVGGDTPDDDDTPAPDEDTNERLKPTLEMRRNPDEEATAVSQQAVPRPASAQPTNKLPNNQPAPSGPKPISATSSPGMVPLPSGLPVLSHSGPISTATPWGASNAFSSPRSNTDAVVKSLQPGRSRLALIVVGAAMLVAATVAVLAGGPSIPARGTIEVVSSPAGAEVRIDGTAISQPTPLVITDVDPARTHHVSVGLKKSLAGGPYYDPWESDVKFEGDNRQVRLQAILVPIVAALEVASTPPGAEVIVNGRIVGSTPTTVGDLSPLEDVVVELRLRGYRVERRSFNFGGKRRLEVSIPLEKAR